VVVVSTFHIELDGGGGELHITLPYSMIEPIRDLLDAGLQADINDQDERWNRSLREDILAAKVPLSACVAKRSIKLRELLTLREGDVLPVELDPDLLLRANGVPTFRVRLGAHKGQLALQVQEPVTSLEKPHDN